jgi:hypothetical protein
MPKRVLKKFKMAHLVALDTAGSEFLFIAGGTVDFLLTRDEALGAYGGFAYTATEAFFMPLTCLVLHLLCACYTHKTILSDMLHTFRVEFQLTRRKILEKIPSR